MTDSESRCPVARALEPAEQLFIPHRKRLSHSYAVNADGIRELRIDYGMKEVTFDEERLFAFGEQLVRQPSFTGAQATTWGPGYAWDELRPLLEALVDEGIIHRGEPTSDPRSGGLVDSPLPLSVCPVPRFWTRAECEAITRDLAGHSIEIGYMEAFVAVFRIAHPALDADDRQVGEGNVYPARLRLDRDTEWRVCQYPGSRFRDEAPMNVTALKAMIKYWKPMMATLLAVRAELAARYALPVAPWTIGQLHVMSCVVLAIPAFQLMRGGGSSPQPPIDPVLSSLFRITDGIRMTTSAMLFSIEHTRRADEPLTAAALYDYAERGGAFVGTTGVCAGPKPLIDEFLATAIDGAPAEGIADLALPAGVRESLARLPEIVDYGLLGLQSWSVSLSVWLAMSRAYQAVSPLLDAAGGDELARCRDRLRHDLRVLEHLQLNKPYDQHVHLEHYRDAYEQAWRGLPAPIGPRALAEAIAIAPEQPMHAEAAAALRLALATRLPAAAAGGAPPPELDGIVAALIRYLREEQAVLAALERLQDAINTRLDRPRPSQPLRARDLRAMFAMDAIGRAYPYLFEALDDALGIRVDCTARDIAVVDRRTL